MSTVAPSDPEAPYPWRGLLIDLCRHWVTPETLRRTLDAMSVLGFNVLHLHLSDDQAHRVESRVWPRLHAVAHDGQFLTRDDVARLVDHADALGIRVVPELDMPGHTTAWISAYPDLAARGTTAPAEARRSAGIAEVAIDPEAPFTFEFVEGLMEEFCELFPGSYLHLGGDEVHPAAWPGRDVTATQASFTDRVVHLAFARGRTPVVWDEAWHPHLDTRVVVQVWRGHARLRAGAAEGRPVLLSTPYYLDLHLDPLHHAVAPLASRSEWDAARSRLWGDPMIGPLAEIASSLESAGEADVLAPEAFDEDAATNVLGGEACLWTEFCDDSLVDLRLWPAAAVVAAVLNDRRRRAEQLGPSQIAAVLGDAEQRLLDVGIDIGGLRSARWLRLADGDPALAGHIATLAECCEPLKWYGRHVREGEIDLGAPLDRFVDALAPRARRHAADAEVRAAADHLVRVLTDPPSEQLEEIAEIANSVLHVAATGGRDVVAIGDVVVRVVL